MSASEASYHRFFGLRTEPFDEAADDGYLTPGQTVARDAVGRALLRRVPVIFVSGEPGVGKTRVVDAAVALLPPEMSVAVRVAKPDELKPDALLRLVTDALDIDSSRAVQERTTIVSALAAAGRDHQIVLVIDLPGAPTSDMLADIGALAKLRGPAGAVMQSVLIGADRKGRLLRRLTGAVPAGDVREIRVEPMPPLQAQGLLEHAFARAGGSPAHTLTDDAADDLVRASRGLPGEMKRIVPLTLNAAFAETSHLVTAAIVRDVCTVPRLPRPRRHGRWVWRTGAVAAGALACLAAGAFLATHEESRQRVIIAANLPAIAQTAAHAGASAQEPGAGAAVQPPPSPASGPTIQTAVETSPPPQPTPAPEATAAATQGGPPDEASSRPDDVREDVAEQTAAASPPAMAQSAAADQPAMPGQNAAADQTPVPPSAQDAEAAPAANPPAATPADAAAPSDSPPTPPVPTAAAAAQADIPDGRDYEIQQAGTLKSVVWTALKRKDAKTLDLVHRLNPGVDSSERLERGMTILLPLASDLPPAPRAVQAKWHRPDWCGRARPQNIAEINYVRQECGGA